MPAPTPARRSRWPASTGSTGNSRKPRLVADAAGDLFGTANTGGSNNSGTVFELTNSGFQVAGVGWLIDAAGNFDDPTRWAGGAVPGAGSDALIDFADQPQVLHNAGSDNVHSLTNTAGDFVMSGGSLTAGALANDSAMSWTGGSLILNSGTGGVATLSNAAGAGLTIAASGQRLTATGAGTASVINAGTITVDGAPGEADIDVAFVNTGQVAREPWHAEPERRRQLERIAAGDRLRAACCNSVRRRARPAAVASS